MKQLIVKLDEELLKLVRIKAIKNDISVKQYITELIEKDLQTKKEQTR